jgi:hypothetical protein
MKRKIILPLLLLLLAATTNGQSCQAARQSQAASIYYSPENLRSDTIDILKYTINLTVGNVSNQTIAGNTAVRFAPKLNNRTYIRLDLLKMTVDSVKEGLTLLTYNYNDTVLRVNFSAPKNTTDTAVIVIYYKGPPVIDNTGWGGFYFDNTQGAQYAYNLGVGFGAKPHNYGRVWFPCFDNFVERSKYEFNITTDTARRAYCNGALVSDIVSGANRTRKWVLDKQIPTYLASVAVAKYSQVNWTINTLTGIKPIVLAAHASDTTALKASFINLPTCITGFENYFGPYIWNRFGYCLVPFGSGAMEHVTNIAYPKPFIGSLTYEADLMAHELSHHWWGDLITCETQEDMWINEGMAVFSSYMFLEWKYGKSSYTTKVKSVHEQLVHFLHLKESFRPISGVPHSLTYGDHVYKKGAEIAHTLRGYLGDSLFFVGLKSVLQSYALKSINSIEFRNQLQAATGQNLTDYFNDWVFAAGWSNFDIDSVRTTAAGGGSFVVTVGLRQKLYGAPQLHNNVPLEISFFRADRSRVVKKAVMSGANATFTFSLPFDPAFVSLNHDGKINDASTHDTRTLKQVGGISFTNGKAFLQMKSVGQDSSIIRVIHHYVKPDAFKYNPALHKLSDQHYWTVTGKLSDGFHSTIRFNYDGTKVSTGNYAYLDTMLTAVNGDSLALFYRKDAGDDWQWVRHFNKVKYSSRTGFIEADTLKFGQYAFANFGDTLLVGNKTVSVPADVTVFPNPSGRELKIRASSVPADSECAIYNVEGKVVVIQKITRPVTTIRTETLAPGTYTLKINSGNSLIYSGKVVVQ